MVTVVEQVNNNETNNDQTKIQPTPTQQKQISIPDQSIVTREKCENENLERVSICSDYSDTSTGSTESGSSGSDNLVCDGVLIAAPQNNPNSLVQLPHFGNINVQNSSEVQVGNNVIYHGPVTINKVLTINDLESGNSIGDNSNRRLTFNKTMVSDQDGDISKGSDNPSYVTTEEHCTSDKVKTAKLDDGLFIITNKNIDEEDLISKGIFGKLFLHQRLLLIISLSLIIFTAALVGIIIATRSSTYTYEWNEDTPELESHSPIGDTNTTITGPNKLHIINRLLWIAQPPIQEANNLTLPVPYVIIHHTATTNCTVRAQCVFLCRQIQTYHIESNGWWDIGYNFLVGGDGLAYEGRGFYKEGAHTYGYNAKSICIAFIGTFDAWMPPKQQIRAAQRLIEKAVNLKVLAPNYKVLAARQLSPTISPGKKLYEEIQTWPHWSEKP